MMRATGLRDYSTLRNDQRLIWQPDALPTEPCAGRGIQREFLSSSEDLVDLDGGKGSGKTDLLFWDDIRPEYYLNPNFHSVTFRREEKRLLEVIGRATKWMSLMPELHAHWQGDKAKQRFVFPCGAWMGFHSVQRLGDEQKFQGWEITKLKFDQLEEFERDQFYFLLLQNRSADKKLKADCRWTCNPGGIGHGWIRKDFITGKTPFTRDKDGKVYWIETKYGTRTLRLSYKRIFGDVFDNPFYRNDETYLAKLANDPNPYRKKMLFKGDWSVVLGQFFIEYASRVHIIDSVPLPKRWNRIAGLDYGNVKTMEFLCSDYEDNVFCEWEYRSAPNDEYPNGVTATQFAEESARWMLDRGIGEGLIVVGDTNMWTAPGRDVGTNKTPARIIRRIWNQRFEEQGKKPPILIKVRKRGNDDYRWRVACNEAIRDGLRFKSDKRERIIEPPKIYFLDRCTSITETLPALVADRNDPRDIAEHQDDHDYDAYKHAYMRTKATQHATPQQVKEWYEEIAEANAGIRGKEEETVEDEKKEGEIYY